MDFDELSSNLSKFEEDYKALGDHFREIAKHEGNTAMKKKFIHFHSFKLLMTNL